MSMRNYAVLSLSLLSACLLHAYETPPGPARLASWPNGVNFSSCSFYELLPQVYSDKVSIHEIKFKTSGFLYDLFGAKIPRKWWIFEPETTTHYLDPVDALIVGTQYPSASIVAEALRIISTTKSMERQTANYGQIKIDALQFIELTVNTIESKVNRARLIKGFAGTLGVLTALATYTNVLKSLEKYPLASDLAKIGAKTLPNEVVGNTKLTEKLAWGTLAALGVTAYMQNFLESAYIVVGIQCLDLLINSRNVIISNKVFVQDRLAKLADKLTAFGFNHRHADQLHNLAACLN